MKTFVCAAVVAVAAFSVAVADEFTGMITKTSDGKITVQKGKGKFDKDTKKFTFEKEGDPKEYTVSKDVKIVKGGKFDKDTKKVTGGDAVEGGLKNEMFTKLPEMGLNARITTDDKGAVTEIRIMGKGGKKKKDGGQ